MNTAGSSDTRRLLKEHSQPRLLRSAGAVSRFPDSLTNQLPFLGKILSELAEDTATRSEVPDIHRALALYRSALTRNDSDEQESALLSLYLQLHAAGSRYSSGEMELLKKRGGYHNYPGGISPLIMAGAYIKPETVFIDLGAGNGLQGLLLQRLYPHRRTIQVEISAEMIRVGKVFQRALDISEGRIDWVNSDIIDTSLGEADFIYLYRPALSSRNGTAVYRSIAERLFELQKPAVIFSVADCLGPFLGNSFPVFYTDGHLTCFAKE